VVALFVLNDMDDLLKNQPLSKKCLSSWRPESWFLRCTDPPLRSEHPRSGERFRDRPVGEFKFGRRKVNRKFPDVRAPQRLAVLLLEDDAGCRYSFPLLWSSQNLKVIVTDDGGEGLEICQDETQAIGAVVVDIFMTKMRGDEFAERLALIRPDLPVIFISGLPEEELIARGILTGAELFFQKPIVTPHLVEKLAELLGIELPKRRKRHAQPAEPQPREPLTVEGFTAGCERENT